jgi:GNAT superfamily N-acetyltransferase
MLICSVREDKTHALRFVKQRGFQAVLRVPSSRLDVTRFDRSRFVPVLDKVKADGIAIYAVAELMTLDPDHRHKIYELDWQCTLDEPMADAPTKSSFADYCNFFFDTPTFIPEACFIAIDNGEYVGLSALYRNQAQATELNTGFTAVLRSHRRRGIATALKVNVISYAQQHGYQGIKTGNEENNPMFAINQRLGFTPEPAWLDFQKV